jgi:L-lactate utilization protein LutB
MEVAIHVQKLWTTGTLYYVRGAQDSYTRAVHCASVRTGCVEPAPLTIPQQAVHLSLRSPSPPIADAALPSPATRRAGSFHPVHGTAARIIARCALCTACAPPCYVDADVCNVMKHNSINKTKPNSMELSGQIHNEAALSQGTESIIPVGRWAGSPVLLTGIEPLLLSHPSCRLVVTPTELSHKN